MPTRNINNAKMNSVSGPRQRNNVFGVDVKANNRTFLSKLDSPLFLLIERGGGGGGHNYKYICMHQKKHLNLTLATDA